jgi:predicted PurR-regulated permease PerM
MEILSFVLGMSAVVVIAVSVVAVIGFVKARKIEKQIESLESEIFRALQSEISAIHQKLNELERGTHQRIDELEREVFSQLDSRLDKLENKLITKK